MLTSQPAISAAGETFAQSGISLSFGPFELHSKPQQLLEDGRPVRLGGRALDLLMLLVLKAGQVVSKSDIMASVWPNGAVEEINLRVHIAALRRALGDGQEGMRYIANVAGRGYAFVARVSETSVAKPPQLEALASETTRRHNLPASLTRLVGRDVHRARLTSLLQQRRFVSIVGPGGVGKTSLALDVGNRMVDEFPQGVWLVELANISEPSRIVPAFAEGIDFALPVDHPLEALIGYLAEKTLLVVLDNCEHMAEAVAPLAVRLLRAAPGLRLLMTSREPMQAEGEWVQRLPALDLPPEAPSVSLAEAQTSPAVQLFVERAIAFQDGFELTEHNAASVAAICRRLDGLPFAIELAAARIDAFGVAGTLRMLEEHSSLLTGDTRARLPRHRAMESLLDWSYDLLSDDERLLLRELSVFRGDFPIEWACQVGMSNGHREAVVEAISSLTTKSLLLARTSGEEVHYGMLQTTRDYAYRKLASTDGYRTARHKHALVLRDFFADTEPNWDALKRTDWLSRHGRTMDDVRFALDWALASGGDAALAVELTLATVLLGCQLSLLQETHDRLSQAIAVLPQLESPDPRLEIRLHLARAVLLTQTAGPSHRLTADFEMTARMSRAVPGTEQYAELANGMWVHAFTAGDYREALGWAEKVGEYAKLTRDKFFDQVFNRLSCLAHHYLGNHAEAWSCAEVVLNAPASKIRLGLHTPTPLDRRVSMRIVKSRILWMTGYADQAVEVAQEAVHYSRSDVAHSFAQAVAWAITPIMLWSGNGSDALPLVVELLEHTSQHNMAHWHDWGVAYELLIRAAPTSDNGLGAVSLMLKHARQRDQFCTFETNLLSATTLSRVNDGFVGWCAPEVFRGSAINLLKSQHAMAFEQATILLDKSLQCARQQRALAWELRTATSLAKLWMSREARGTARSVLEPVFSQLSEGFATQDVSNARAVLEAAS